METKNVMIVGVGGQGTLLTSRVLGGLAVRRGFDVKLSEVHGMAQRGGSVVTFVRYGESVAAPVIEPGQADVLIAFERLEALRYAHFLKKDGVAIINDHRMDPVTVMTGAFEYPENIIEDLSVRYKTVSANATAFAAQMGAPKAFNIVVLGLVARHLDFSYDDWLSVIETVVPPKTVEMNKKAFEAGYNGLHIK